ncbi:MAG: septum site-determining protein MinC [Anaerolineae bacterium]|uniref:septum site-determining protein MinC n=1 Tax=Candidatus Flexifilum breve TaxID=3140694 RepID=UPI001AD4A4DE|nr:septum site-determining protein MinC [Chloroflexota bacterium]MBK9750600.1 septum site-determining protein MinC [Chloroflexota bacterium]MBN8638047.1 septum site-determining protein MinC [Anaerolineae bacterium]
MSEQTVAIKGVKDGLLVTVSESEDWQIIVKDLAARIDQQSSFYSGARVTLDVGARPVRKDELSSLKAMLERRNISLWSLQSDSATSIEAASALDLRAHLITTNAGAENPDAIPFNPEEDGTIGVMIRRTLRSGRTVHSDGHVVVYGDVNPGAEIIAAGDVIVWGRLRGNVHAGSEGDETAVICALDMTPTQIRIAGLISIPPKDKRHKPKPEIASIRDRQIVVVTWG